MTRFEVPGAPVWSQKAWTPGEVRAGVEACLNDLSSRMPATGDLIFLKPDLSSDRFGLSGGTTDLRVLVAVVEALQDRGYRRLVLGDAPPPAWGRAKVDPARRLRIDRLIAHYGLRWLDINRTPTVDLELPVGRVKVTRAALDAALVINLPTVRTDAAVGLALGALNLVGLMQSVYRPLIMRDASSSLNALAERIRPGITLVDGLVMMEGDAPLEGKPVRVGQLFWSERVLHVDLLVARLLGYTPEEVPHLWRALREDQLPHETAVMVESQVAVLRELRRPTGRGPARKPGQMIAAWVQRSVSARADGPGWRTLAGAMHLNPGIDVREDSLRQLTRDPERCGTCRRCEQFCPVGLVREEIGAQPPHDRCLQCLYCFQVCGRDALSVVGEGGALLDLIRRDKDALVTM